MAFSSSNNHGCTTTPLPSLTGQGAYYIDITYWVDVDKARATQEKMKQEKLQAGSDSHLFDKLYVDNPWFSNLDFMALLEFTKQPTVIPTNYDVSVHAQAGEGFCMYRHGSACYEVIVVTVTKDNYKCNLDGFKEWLSSRWGDNFLVFINPPCDFEKFCG